MGVKRCFFVLLVLIVSELLVKLGVFLRVYETSLVAQWWGIVLQAQEMRAQSLGQEDPLEERIAPYSSILALEILWTEEPGGLQSIGSQRVEHDLMIK